MSLTETFAIWPTASASSFCFVHPQSYVAVGRIDRDLVEDYAVRKDMSAGRAREAG